MNSFTGHSAHSSASSEHSPAPIIAARDIRTGQHFVQFYEQEEALVSSVASFIGAGLGAGDAAIIIATKAHCAAFDMRLMTHGLSVAGLKARKQLVIVDAAEVLEHFFKGATFDEKAFGRFTEDSLHQAVSSGRAVHVFGELVALLCQGGNHKMAVRVEKLWNEKMAGLPVDVLCAYPMASVSGAANAHDFACICKEHSHVIPSDNYTSKHSLDERLRQISLLQQQADSLAMESRSRMAAEALANEQQATLLMAASVAELGAWEFEMATSRLICSPRCKAILGLKSFDASNCECITQSVHPDDCARVQRALHNAIADAKGCFEEFRIVHSSGKERLVKIICRYTLQGGARIIGFVQDVTVSDGARRGVHPGEKPCTQN